MPRHPDSQYQRLAQILQREIESGSRAVGSLLPTEEALCAAHGVSRITVRAAMRELERLGLILRRARVGTRVIAATPSAVFMHDGDSVDGVLQFTRTLPFHLLDIAPAVGDDDLTAADLAALPPEDGPFLRVTGVRGAPGQPPLLYSVHMVPQRHAAAVARFDGCLGSLPQWLAEASGETVAEIRQVFDATGLSREAALALQMHPGEPALRTRRAYHQPGGRLIVRSTTVGPQGRYVFSSVLRRETR
jgi:DNA-binding GntR family transcriptional regulator